MVCFLTSSLTKVGKNFLNPENSVTFYAYMVLEQGALTGGFNQSHPFSAGTGRGDSYNPHLKELE